MGKNYRSPGPKYDAPTTIGHEKADLRLPRAPAYSLGHLVQTRQIGRMPGPKYDVSNITNHGPIKILGGTLLSFRTKEKYSRTPGPAAYDVGPCMPVTKPTMPQYSIGIKRNGLRKPAATPAPNKYLLAPSIGNRALDLPAVPMYTIGGRAAEPGSGTGGRKATSLISSPGPARYSAVQIDRYKRQTPRPIMLGRSDMGALHGKGKRTPAPNAYFPRTTSRYKNAPQYSIGGRIRDQADPYFTAADRVPDWDC